MERAISKTLNNELKFVKFACNVFLKSNLNGSKGPFIYRVINFGGRGGQPFYHTATVVKIKIYEQPLRH